MLTDTIEGLKKEIELADKREAGEEEEVVVEPEKAEEAKPEEGVAEVAKEAEVKPEAKPEVKEELDNTGYARLRRETAAAKKKAEDAEAKAAKLEAQLSAPTIEEIEAKPESDPEIEEIKQERNFKKAERQFQNIEHEFKSKAVDYEGVSMEYGIALAQSIRIQNPKMAPSEIAEETKKTILLKASAYMRDGFNPVEELYHEAKELGFTGNSLKPKEEAKAEAKEEKEEIVPDMRKLAANRAKSSGMTGANGKSEGQMTKQAASNLPVGEWLKIPFKERQRIMQS